MSGKVVVNRCMSLDGFIAGPGDSMDWGGGRALADFIDPVDLEAVAAATGGMLVGRRTWDVGERMKAEEPTGPDYPFAGPMFLLTHRPLDPPLPGVTILSGDIGDAVGTALAASGGKDLEILGADVARQCLQRGLVDEILVYVLPLLLGDGTPFSSRGLSRTDLEPSAAAPGRATPPSCGSGSSPGRPLSSRRGHGVTSVSDISRGDAPGARRSGGQVLLAEDLLAAVHGDEQPPATALRAGELGGPVGGPCCRRAPRTAPRPGATGRGRRRGSRRPRRSRTRTADAGRRP